MRTANSAQHVLVSAIDRNYVVPYAAMLASFRDHNPAMPVNAFVIHNDLLDDDRRLLDAISQRTGIRLDLIEVPAYPFRSFVTRPRSFLGWRDRMSPIAYAKAFLDRFLPSDIGRVICVDADVIVNGDMSEIWQMEITSSVMAAANIPRMHFHQFNSGFMLLDLAEWRRWRIADIAEKFLSSYSDALHSHDQHVLNLIFKNRWSKINLKWNYIEDHYRLRAEPSLYTEAEVMAAREAPVIIHYAVGTDKPWSPRCRHPRVELYRKYRAGLEMLIEGLDLMDPQDAPGYS
ncbi:MAG TPA: glycosyltransferase family 8 protein [Dongiaceae bacterium]|nr:glycosyltransferase family 8 protein [Dongiaceae bacterium]